MIKATNGKVKRIFHRCLAVQARSRLCRIYEALGDTRTSPQRPHTGRRCISLTLRRFFWLHAVQRMIQTPDITVIPRIRRKHKGAERLAVERASGQSQEVKGRWSYEVHRLKNGTNSLKFTLLTPAGFVGYPPPMTKRSGGRQRPFRNTLHLPWWVAIAHS